jgi:hypothetical protein
LAFLLAGLVFLVLDLVLDLAFLVAGLAFLVRDLAFERDLALVRDADFRPRFALPVLRLTAIGASHKRVSQWRLQSSNPNTSQTAAEVLFEAPQSEDDGWERELCRLRRRRPGWRQGVLEMSRSKIATWASVGFAVAVLAGWVVEAAVKWAVGWVLSHFQ